MLNEAERNSMKTGLVLEGGAMRGIYTAGVLDVFMEHEMHFDGVIGVSAGALHGCSFVSGQKGRSIRYYEKYRGDKHFMSFWSLLCTGDIVGEKFCYHEIPQWLDPFDYEAFYKSDTDFYVGCSNLETGMPEYLRIKDMLSEIDLMRASASMPYVSRIVKFHGMKLLDGGCTDSIPVRAFQRMGYQKNVVVLTRHEGYAKEPELLKPAKLFYRKYPLFIKALKSRHIVYNRTLEQIRAMEQKGEVFVIRPSEELVIKRMEGSMEEIRKVYNLGRKDAENRMEELLKWKRRSLSI